MANCFQTIRKYFNKKEWEELCDYEKLRYLNIKRNYDAMTGLGLEPGLPEFMRPKRRVSAVAVAEKEDEGEDEEESNSGSDEEWTPKKFYESKRSYADQFRNPKSKKTNQTTTSRRPTTETPKTEKYRPFSGKPKPESFQGFKTSMILYSQAYLKKMEQTDHPSISEFGYQLRDHEGRNHREPEVPEDDDYILCDECDKEYEGDCLVHGPLTIVENIKLPNDGSLPDRALKSLPPYLKVDKSSIDGAGQGVFALKLIAKDTRFGPYEGTIERHQEDVFKQGYAWQVSKNGKRDHFVDARDPSRSNWLRFVNCACREEDQNLVAFQYQGQIYYRTYKDVPAHTELLVWYGDGFARDLGIPMSSDESENEEEVEEKDENDKEEEEKGENDKPVQSNEQRIDKGTFFECDVCHALFSNQNVLQRHRKSHANKSVLKRHKCPECLYSTDKAVDLRRHLRTHTKDKPYVCDQCHKGFSQMSDLQRHLRTHTKDKPYVCDQCHKGFSLMAHLQRHLRTHTKEKPHVCDQCQLRFTSSQNMKRHVIHVHTKKFPSECVDCGKGYMCPSELRRHRDKHHPNEE